MFKTLITATALIAASAAMANSSVTKTVDTPNYEGSRTTTRDGAGNVSRSGELTRKADGATATHSFHRSREGGIVTSHGTRTGFEGKTRSFAATRHVGHRGRRAG